MSEARQRIMLIGAGYIAREHALAIRMLPNAATVELAVADPNPAALASFVERFPGTRAVADAKELLAEPARPDDIVVVATPPFLHRDLTIRALGSGRHVLCEKPLAMDGGEAKAMVDAARAAGRSLGDCSSRFLGMPTTAMVREMVAAGDLGSLTQVTFVHRVHRFRTGIDFMPESTWFLDSRRSGGGVLMDWGCYDLTTLIDLLRPVRVDVTTAWSVNPETALNLAPGVVFDTDQQIGASLVFHRADGSRVPIIYERAAATHGEERQIVEIEGRRGAVRWDWLDWVGDGRVTVTTDRDGQPAETTHHPGRPVAAAHQRPLLAFAARLRGEPNDAVVDGQALFNFRCLRALQDAATTGLPQTVEREELAG